MDGPSLCVQRGAVHAITAPPGDRPFSTLGEGAGSTHGLMRG